MGSDLVEVNDLEIVIRSRTGAIRPVRGVNFNVKRGEFLAIVGESGAGKSMTAAALLGIRPSNASIGGSVRLRGSDMLSKSYRELRKARGNQIAIVFQEPMTALNPLRTVGYQLAEAVRAHRSVKRREARNLAIAALEQVGIGQAQARIDSYPHEFSGGMRQRVLIAMAIINDPDILIADEPTTALDVTVQAQVLETLQRVRKDRGLAIVLVTHDLGIVAAMAERVLVMYAGRIVEEASTVDLFRHPSMPYTAGLLASIPHRGVRGVPLKPIPGNPPSPVNTSSGCRFAPRCPAREARCDRSEPVLEAVGAELGHRSACWRASELTPKQMTSLFGSKG